MAEVILNVDDFEPQRYARSCVLRSAGFEVVEAATGRRAIALTRERHPDLVVLDVHLPDIDGLEVCRTIKSQASTSAIPVLQLSATFRDAGARKEALDNGADAYLAEPVEGDELVAQVRALLRLQRAERVAHESQILYRRLFEHMSEAFFLAEVVCDDAGRPVDYRYLDANPAFEALTGQPREAVIGRTLREAFPEVGQTWIDAYGRVALTGEPARFQRFVPQLGRHYATVAYSPQPGRFACLFADVTEEKLTEAALRAAKELAEAREAEIASIYDAAPIGLCIFDRDGRYVRINRHLAEVNGLPPEEHLGRTFREVVPAIATQAERLLRQVFDTGQPALGVEIQGEVPSQPGVTRTWIENWHPVRDQGGAIVGVNVAAQEITGLKEAEQELRDANRVKDDFLATLSHELRTPLTAILGWSHLLQRGLLDQVATRRAVEAITRNAEAQQQLITDVLDVSRMISGKLRLDVREVDLLEVTDFAVATVRPALDAKGIVLEVVSEVDHAPVTADPDRLQQIVWNLLSNAAKFTPAGGRVGVRVRRVPTGVELSVSDTGVGIAPAFLARVFDRFAQADSSASRRHGGLGLGLSIVRQLVELHGGEVRAASDGEGKGATFTVSLPLRAVRDTELQPGTPKMETALRPVRTGELDGLRVLVVDDLEDARLLVGMVIEQAGGRATLAGSAEEALAVLPSERPDLVLADIGMPDKDGYEFLRRLRGTEAGRDIPVVALTAYGSAADRAKALEAGFVEHLGKPVVPQELVGQVSRIARSSRSD